MAKEKALHMIGHAHLDPVWFWRWPEGFHAVKATFRSALDRMAEDEEFCFVASSAAFYEWVEQIDPQMFAEIKTRVAEGRWELVGGWWVEPDCNLPGGESFVRQGLYGQRYFQEKFGVTAKVGFNPDSFGHHGMLPQILKKSGLDYYVFMRPMPNEMGLPGRLFWWEADDGSRVLAYRIPFEYLTWGKDVDHHVRRCAQELKPPVNNLMCFYGVGNHGGGPTKANLASIKALQKDPDLPALVFNQPSTYFKTITQQERPLPTVHAELQHHASGCYAAHSGIKKWNRLVENRLLKAEKFSILADWLVGQPYPGDYGLAWKNLLFCQFHDVLAGTSLAEAYDDARNMLGEALSIADRGMNYALQALSWQIKIAEEEGMKPVVVFNPHSWASKVEVELETDGLKKEHTLVDDEGHAVPYQLIQTQATANGRYRISFIADLPSFGYRVYRLLPHKPEERFLAVKAGAYTLENKRYRLEFDPKTGFLTSLYDKKKNFEVLDGPAARPMVIADPSDTWSHNVFRFDQEEGAFTARKIRLVETGPVKAVLRVESAFNNSVLWQDFTIYQDLPQIEVRVRVDWREQFRMLKLKFPIKLNFRKVTSEIPYGHIERGATGMEEPGQSWLDVTGMIPGLNETYGISIINDAKYSYAVLNKELTLTVLRSPIYAHHDPAEPHPDKDYTFIDQGRQEFTYWMLPHAGSWEEAGTVQRALELNQPAVCLLETYHQGELPLTASFLEVDQSNVAISVLKRSEEGDDQILRCYETNGQATEVKITLPYWGRVITTRLGSGEIKTFRVPRNKQEPVQENNLLEW